MVQPAEITEKVRTSASDGDWAERVGRVGLVARGIVYALLGVVAFRVAWGDRSETADKGGALQLLQEQPFGDALLLLVTIGLACYAVWCLIEALFERPDPGEDGATDTAKVWAKRAGDVGRAVAYGIAFATAVSVLRHDPSAGGAGTERSLTAEILAKGGPGQLVIGAIGLGFIAAGLWNAYRAVTTKFEKHLVVDAGPSARKGVRIVGIAGLLGRGVAFVAIGWFVVDAARAADPNQPLGLDESLATLASGPLGPVGLSAVAIGLFLFGIYSFAEARWKQLGTDASR
jgi:hypothetical protein